MSIKKSLAGFAFVGCLLVAPLNALGADEHYTGYSAVDNKEIRWGTATGTTKYTAVRDHSISTWNALKKVNIAPDTASTIEDLSFFDFNSPSTLLGYYVVGAGADTIGYNEYNFKNMKDEERKKTALHEMGHALGFGHHDAGIMEQGIKSMTTLDDHIKSDYNSLY